MFGSQVPKLVGTTKRLKSHPVWRRMLLVKLCILYCYPEDGRRYLDEVCMCKTGYLDFVCIPVPMMPILQRALTGTLVLGLLVSYGTSMKKIKVNTGNSIQTRLLQWLFIHLSVYYNGNLLLFYVWLYLRHFFEDMEREK